MFFTIWTKILRYFLGSRESYKRLRPLDSGVAGAPIPEGYVYYRQSYEYLKGEAQRPEVNTIIKIKGGYAVRTEVEPGIFIESHATDEEPKPQVFPYDRLILWESLTRLDCPSGWRRPIHQHSLRKIGITELKNDQKYWEKWDAHARRHRRKWLAQKELRIEEVTAEDFAESFERSDKVPQWRQTFLQMLERRSIRNRKNLKLFGALDSRGQIVAGLGVLDLPDVHTSKHMIAFFHNEFGKTSVNVGLIDHWFQYCLKKEIPFLDLGIFWHPGDKAEFKGFSKFKSQFNVQYIVLPSELERWCKAGESW